MPEPLSLKAFSDPCRLKTPGVFLFCFLYAAKMTSVSCIVQELCESRGGRPGLSVLTSLLVSVDVKNY